MSAAKQKCLPSGTHQTWLPPEPQSKPTRKTKPERMPKMKPYPMPGTNAPRLPSGIALILSVLLLSATGCAAPSTSRSTPSPVVTCPPPPPMPAPTEAQPSEPYLTTWNALVQKWREQLQGTLPTR